MLQKRFSLFQANLTFFLFVMGIIAQEFFVSVLMIAGGDWLSQNMFVALEAVQTATYLLLVAAVLFMGVSAKTGLGYRGFSIKQLAVTVATAVCAYVAVSVLANYVERLMALLGFAPVGMEMQEELMAQPWWAALIVLCVAAPVFEEFFFRGAIYSGYESRCGVARAALISGIFFVMVHAYLPTALILLPVGIILGLVRGYTGSIWLSMIMHALHNFIDYTGVMNAYVLKLPETVLPEGLRTVGGECWLAVLLLAACAGLFFCLRALKKWHSEKKTDAAFDGEYADTRRGTGFLIPALAVLGVYILIATLSYTARIG